MATIANLGVVVIAIMLSALIIIVTTATHLHRTPLCGVVGMGVTIMVWSAYPPAQQLSPMAGILFWMFISLMIYRFPDSTTPAPPLDPASLSDDDLLDQFFKETNPHDA